ncbi:MAG: hypothetical protein Q4C49_10245 [Bacillota bacterium]|nr:hypothetical protein [Bacillota bacterium]
MIDYDQIKKDKKNLKRTIKSDVTKLGIYSQTINRINVLVNMSEDVINEIDCQFERKTKINKEDYPFLFLAVALQVVRQQITSFEERMPHDVSDKKAHEMEDYIFQNELSKRFLNDTTRRRYYYASITEMITKGVPYDVTKGTKKFNLGNGINENIGFTGNTHRVKTLGHDPVLGFVFGTSNIMTSTLTTNTMRTVHVYNGAVVANASTKKMFDYAIDRAINDKKALIVAFVKQYLHIMSDELSKSGIPLPFLSVSSEELTYWLMDIGIDFANVKQIGKQGGYALLINMIILCLYSVYKYGDINKGFIKVKAYKIIEIAGIIASSSNIIQVLLTKDIKKLDVGGMVVTVSTIIKSKDLQNKLKQEFLCVELKNLVDEL